MDPFQMGLLTLGLGQNPEAFSSLMAAQGVSPAAIGQPNTVMPFQAGGLGQALMPGQLPEPVAPPAAAPAAPTPAMSSALSAMKGVKAPQDNRPIMQAGVSGSQNAPQAQAIGNNSMIDLMRLLAPAAGPAVPNLGSLLKGI